MGLRKNLINLVFTEFGAVLLMRRVHQIAFRFLLDKSQPSEREVAIGTMKHAKGRHAYEFEGAALRAAAFYRHCGISRNRIWEKELPQAWGRACTCGSLHKSKQYPLLP